MSLRAGFGFFYSLTTTQCRWNEVLCYRLDSHCIGVNAIYHGILLHMLRAEKSRESKDKQIRGEVVSKYAELDLGLDVMYKRSLTSGSVLGQQVYI